MKLDSLTVGGTLRGASAHTPINIEADKDINVPPGGVVGGSNPNAGGSHQSVPVTLDSKGNMNIGGRVEGNGGPVNLPASGNITISGVVNSWGGGTTVKSDTGSVSITNGGIVAADGNVEVTSGDGEPTTIECHVHSREENVIINKDKKKGEAGNVRIGKQDTVSAYKEVIINADTLIIEGTIIAHTVQKNSRVTLMDSTGSITDPQGRPLSLKNKIDTLHATKEKTDGRPGEKGSHVSITGMEHSRVNFSASPSAIDADMSVRVTTGPGGTIDLTGNYPGWPVIQCPGPISLNADVILLDPGVPVETICGPGPVLVGPSMSIPDVATGCVKDATGYPGRDAQVEFVVRNMGNVDDTYDIAVTDSKGWSYTVSDYTLAIPADQVDSVVTITLSVPEWALPYADTNVVTVRATSQMDPTVYYEETTSIAVDDSNCLRDFSLNPWEIVSGHPGDTARVSFWIMNVGLLDDDYLLEVDDSLGWKEFEDEYFPIPWWRDSIYAYDIDIPPTSFDGEVNKVWVTLTSLGDPANVKRDTVTLTVGVTTGVDDGGPLAPNVIRHAAYPNPFNPSVTFRFTVPARRAETSIEIYDPKGALMRTLALGRLDAGEHSTLWDGRGERGTPLASGVYFYKIRVGPLSASGKLVLLR